MLGHCEEQPTLRFLNATESLIIGGYACHGAYLSRVVVYAQSVGVKEARDMVQSLLGSEANVAEEDIRVKSVYPWDIDLEGDGQKMLTAAYWTQNYRRSKTEDLNRTGLFLCGKCRSVFPQIITERQILCSDCRTSTNLDS